MTSDFWPAVLQILVAFFATPVLAAIAFWLWDKFVEQKK